MTYRDDQPVECARCNKIHTRCKAHKGTEPCQRYPKAGAEVCDSHGGRAPQVAARAAVRGTVMRWGLDQPQRDPGETLLKLVSQSAARCELYARLLGEAYEAAERLQASGETPQSDLLATETARMDLERIFNTGGVGVLIGHKYAGTQTSGVIATGEAIRGLAELETQERKLCAELCKTAVAAGLAERMVRHAEQAGALVAQLMRAVLADPRLDEAQRALLGAVFPDHLRMLAAPPVIEGQAA